MSREFLTSIRIGNIEIRDVSGDPYVVGEDGIPIQLEARPTRDEVSPLNKQGDLWAYSTEDDRLPVGDDGQVLKADSKEDTGLIWADWPAQQEHIADADGTLADLTTKFNTLLSYLETWGFIADT